MTIRKTLRSPVKDRTEASGAAPEDHSRCFTGASAIAGIECDGPLLVVERLGRSGIELAAQCLERFSRQRWKQILRDAGNAAVSAVILRIGEGCRASAGGPAWRHDADFEDRLAQLLELIPKLKKLGNLNE